MTKRASFILAGFATLIGCELHAAEEVVVLSPHFQHRQVENGLLPFLSGLERDSGIEYSISSVTWNDQDAIVAAAQATLNEGNIIILIGWTETALNYLLRDLDYEQPGWLQNIGDDYQDALINHGVVNLGAGFRGDNEYGQAILSAPSGRETSIPILSAQILSQDFDNFDHQQNWGSLSDSGVAELFVEFLFRDDAGYELMRSLTFIPNRLPADSDGYFDLDDPRLTSVRIRPSYDSDGDECGCEGNDSDLQTCDPDSYEILALDELQRREGRAIVPGFLPDTEDDGDENCDQCTSSYVYDLYYYENLPSYSTQLDYRSSIYDSNTLGDHFRELYYLMGTGSIVKILTCDPD